MVGIRLSSVWEQNMDGLLANHHTDERKEHVKKPLERVRGGGYGLVTIKRVSSHMFCPSLATKRLNEVIRINVSQFLLSLQAKYLK